MSTFDPTKPLAQGKDENHFITHDGVELHVRDIQVRLITREPTHFPFINSYTMVKKVMEDSPEEFQKMFEWRAIADLESPNGAAPKDIELKKDGDLYYQTATYLDFDGKKHTRKIMASTTVMMQSGLPFRAVEEQNIAIAAAKKAEEKGT